MVKSARGVGYIFLSHLLPTKYDLNSLKTTCVPIKMYGEGY